MQTTSQFPSTSLHFLICLIKANHGVVLASSPDPRFVNQGVMLHWLKLVMQSFHGNPDDLRLIAYNIINGDLRECFNR